MSPQALRNKNRREERKLLGVCGKCIAPVQPGFFHCEDCRADERERITGSRELKRPIKNKGLLAMCRQLGVSNRQLQNYGMQRFMSLTPDVKEYVLNSMRQRRNHE
jgi:hypothetical protein